MAYTAYEVYNALALNDDDMDPGAYNAEDWRFF
jgi:hypothetical protein